MTLPRDRNRWFHTVVVVGASLSGCGGQSVRYVDEADAGAGSSGPSGGSSGIGGSSASSGGLAGTAVRLPSPGDCASYAEFVCADYAALRGCYCNTDAPEGPSDCSSPYAFRCQTFPPGSGTTATRQVGCSCATNYPTPETCPTPQLVCDPTELGFANCRCDPSRPTSRDACEPGSGEYYSCQSYEPDFGCICQCCVIR